MIKRYIHLSTLTLLISFLSYGQKINRYDEILLFKESKSQKPILIINDSLVYKGKTLIPFKHTEYPDKLSNYIPLNVNSKNYLVHSGCGPVLEYRNDSIVRIDKSYLHRNQFGSIPFVYKNEIYLFGGYGLFTTKNIITRFSFTNGEWNQEQTYGKQIPEPRCCEIKSFKKNNKVYFFGGFTKDPEDISKTKKLPPEIWRLDLSSMTWENLGNYNSELDNPISHFIQIKDKLYLLNETLLEINYSKNQLNKYDFSSHIQPKFIYANGDTICGVFEDNKGNLFFDKKSIREIKGKQKGSFPLIINPINNFINEYIILILILIIILFAAFIFKSKYHSKKLPKIHYNSTKKEFSYKNKKNLIFEENEKKILLLLLEHSDEFISLNKINELFENPIQPESISATIKRRELAINGLLNKVSKLTSIPEAELLLERKNLEDKRLKDLLLLPNLLKKVK